MRRVALAERALALVAVATAVLGCKPDFGTPASLVTGPRILAVRAEPAEVRAGGHGDLHRARRLARRHRRGAGRSTGRLCLTPKPLDENNVVATACLGDKGLTPVAAAAPTATATVPPNACALFGPDPPPQMPGQPPLRPRDPDVTGGYYQPLRLVDGEVTGFALERVTCNLAQAGADLAVAVTRMTYQANENPTLQPLTATVDGAAVALDAHPRRQRRSTSPSAGRPRRSRASRSSTSTRRARHAPRVDARLVVRQRRRLRRTRSPAATRTTPPRPPTTTWTAPPTPGTVHLWLVLRDSRGGVDFAAYDVVVVP